MKKVFLVLLVLIAWGCTSKPVMNVQNEYVPTTHDGEELSINDVEKAILSATQKRGWSSRVVKPGLIEASISVRTHRATIEIPYSSSSYSINYKSSENLDYDDGSIHRNYNNWVINLSRTIQGELGVNAQNY
jgi:hypothetical protein